ncbi:putative aminohydrolase SsnA [Photobacterium gaetbulicola]|uniref:Putative chlorohydrolase/aminohydrolase n=1 Tax=Photobacterium gaetbulicola Gung47 TaxID=658445 RepID=A0A0C5WVR6_9GAMM|nr:MULTISPECIES: putative aminohydrolase SsnA [Photobacterium]AJR09149.1 putative chlorohydrolase/aminohydrolase [Photobacterium gaetbulicola Gung47]PSU11798.1 putative aminohydrolase SsnA [Photobacterium gaetbulicola]WEM41262.1 putative aminohydrolase SsnA [Photobacterium sp. DA100]
MLVLRNATAVQFEPALIKEGVDIVIDGDKIKEVGANLAANYPDAQVKDMKGKLVMPGIVCSHNHFYSGLARGIMADIKPSPDFISILKNLWWRMDRALDEEALYYSGLICSLEAIKCGCSSVIDHHASPNYIAGSLNTLRKGFLKAGLRGMTCFETTDRNHGMKEMVAGVEENIAFAQLIDRAKENGEEPYLVEAHIGAHAPFTVTNDGLSMMAEAVQATGRGIHVHVAEDRYDVTHSHHHYGQDIVERLDSFGLINEKTLLAHGLFLSEKDIAILNAKNGFLVHNARSNMNNNVGYNDKLMRYQNVALGTDGIGADMFEELKFAFFKHRDAGGPLWPDSFLRHLWNGNEILARNFGAKFGRLDAGNKADLTVLDYTSPTPLVADNLPGHIAFGFNAGNVNSVVVEGRFVYEDREFPFDVAPIYAEARKVAMRLWQTMDKLD